MRSLSYTLEMVGQTSIDDFYLYVFVGLEESNAGAAFASNAEFPAGVAYDQVWSNGILVLFDSAPVNLAQDAAAVITLINQANIGTGVIWIANAARLGGGGLLPRPATTASVAFRNGQPNTIIANLQQIPIGSLQLGIAANTPVQFSNDALVFSNLSLNAPTLFITTFAGRKFATVGPSVVSPDYDRSSSSVSLSLATETFGCWQFILTLEKDTGRNLQSDMELLDAGLHYYAGGDMPATLYYPVFDTGAGSLSLSVTADTLQPANTVRSHFTLPNTPIPSYFRTCSGNPVTLQPGTDASLVFTKTGAGYTVTPTGSFAMGFIETSPELLCGLTGTEYMKLSAGSVLYFSPGQDAYSADPAQTGATLDNTETTAWVSIVPLSGSTVAYGFQSPRSLLYEVGQPGAPWDVLEFVAAQLSPETPPEPSDYYPLVPYAGVRQRTNSSMLMGANGLDTTFYQAYQAYETLLLNTRKGIVEEGVQPPSPGNGSIYGVTAQGFLVQFDSNLVDWQELILAQGENAQPGTLCFNSITGGFQTALEGNQLFIVMDNTVNSLSPSCFTAPDPNLVEFAGWTFDFAPANWAQCGTIAIIKYHGSDLYTLVSDTSNWSWPAAADLSNGSGNTQQQLLAIFEDAATQAQTNNNYVYLNQIINDPNWQGILYFNVPMQLDTIPSDLAMLSAGIDPSLLYAHHVGVNITSVLGLNITGSPDINPSSAFGLIVYNDPTPLVTSASYAYQVSALQVLFQQSLNMNIQASVQLVVNALFGHAATLQGGSQVNLINLAGSAQSHNGQISLVLNSNQTEVFSLANSVIEQVEVDTVQFFSLNTPDTSQKGGDPTVNTRFLFTGALKFVDLSSVSQDFKQESFDFYSFDRLAYQQLRLDMDYSFNQPGLASFTFDPDYLSFSISQSTPRASSLVNQLTLCANSFTSALMGTTPQTLNFIPLVVTPFNNQSGASGIWYGLVCELPLGSMGSLAPHKTLNLEVLLAWCPAPDGGNTPDTLWFGVRLPGANSSGVFFNIEDVIKMGIKQILLSEGADGSPILTFQNIGLSVLGQTIPPGGQTSVTLAGDASGRANVLAWFAEYLKNTN